MRKRQSGSAYFSNSKLLFAIRKVDFRTIRLRTGLQLFRRLRCRRWPAGFRGCHWKTCGCGSGLLWRSMACRLSGKINCSGRTNAAWCGFRWVKCNWRAAIPARGVRCLRGIRSRARISTASRNILRRSGRRLCQRGRRGSGSIIFTGCRQTRGSRVRSAARCCDCTIPFIFCKLLFAHGLSVRVAKIFAREGACAAKQQRFPAATLRTHF